MSTPERLPTRLARRARSEAGFTWSEVLLVAVFVIGLAVVGLQATNGIRHANAHSDCQTELRTLKLAVEDYHANTGTYPTRWEDLKQTDLVDGPGRNWTFEPKGADQPPDYRPTSPLAC